MTATTTARQLDSENPWPGLESFGESAHDFFFGRDREAASLLNHVHDAPVTVLYGRSGLGKTSLLQAGLFPLLREENFLPVYVRLELQQGSTALSRQLHQSIYGSIQANAPDALLPAADESLWEYLHRSDFELWSAQNYPLTPVIVIDQFEELFTLGERVPDLVREFMNDLGDLAENRIPADVAARIDNDEAEADRFQLRAHNYKLLITLREDFLPHLEEWSQLIPALKRSRVRLLPLHADKAFDAVYKPAAHLMSAGLAERVVRIVAGEDLGRSRESASTNGDRSDGGTSGVEPALLSLFCRELNEERKRRGQSEFDEHLVEDAKRDILANYYSSCVRDLPPRVAEFIESELITEKGFRDSYAREDAVPSRLTEDELSRLIGSRLLRLEEYHGAQRIELTHDVLTGVVREHRDRRRAEEAQRRAKALEDAATQREAELDRERQARRRLRKLAVALAFVCVVALGLAVAAFVYQQKADNRLHEALAERLSARGQLMLLSVQPGSELEAFDKILAAQKFSDKPGIGGLLTALISKPQLQDVVDLGAGGGLLSADGLRVVTATDKGIRVLDAVTGDPTGMPFGDSDAEWKARAVSRDGRYVVVSKPNGDIRVWDSTDGKPVGQMNAGGELVPSIAISPDGSRVAASVFTDRGLVRLWDVRTGHQIFSHDMAVDAATDMEFDRTGRTIAVGTFTGAITVLDTTKGTLQVDITHSGNTAGNAGETVSSLAFSPDGQTIAAGGSEGGTSFFEYGALIPVNSEGPFPVLIVPAIPVTSQWLSTLTEAVSPPAAPTGRSESVTLHLGNRSATQSALWSR